MLISETYMGNHNVDFKSIKIEATDVLTTPKVVNINPTVQNAEGSKTVGYAVGEGFNNVWFELKTSVVGVTGAYDSATGNITLTKATNWVASDVVGILFSIFTTVKA